MLRATFVAVLAFACAAVQAQQPNPRPPDAGSTLRESQQPAPERARPAPPAPRIETPERPALAAPASARFEVTAFRVSGNSAFPSMQLEDLVRDLAGRELGLAELQEAAARITRFYREHGYPVARAYLPAQDVRNGVVEIAVLEGRYGKVEQNNGSRVNGDVVGRYVESLKPGTAIEGTALERSLLLISDLPGVAAPDAVLRPGAGTGESDLALALQSAPLVSGNLAVDNYGNRYTGIYRASGAFSLASPTGYGDLLTARATTTGSGLDSEQIAYQLPVGGQGFRVGAAYSNTDYRLGKQFSQLDSSGYARVATLNAMYPFVRSLALNVYGQLSYDAKRLEDRIGALGTVSPKRNDGATASIAGDWRDLGGKAFNSFSLAFMSGRLSLDSSAARQLDDAGPRTNGGFSKIGYAVSRLQPIAGPLSGFVALAGQRAGKNLDSSEKFLVGGPFGVRAYPVGEAASDDAFVITGELRYRIPQAPIDGLELAAHLDHGQGHLNHNAFAPGANVRVLSGAGLGVNVASNSGWLLRAAWSWRLSGQPATSDTPRSGRGWLQLAKFF